MTEQERDYSCVVDHGIESCWGDISKDDRVLGRELKYLKEKEPEKLADLISKLSGAEAEDILHNEAIWARDKQLVDFDDLYTVTMMMCGRGFGKTYSLSVTIKRAVENYGVKKITVMTQTNRDIRATVVPEIIERYPEGHANRPEFKGNLNTMKFPNGAQILFISAEAGADAPRGTQCELLLGDEVAFYGNSEDIVTQALLTCRLGISRAYFFTTPKSTPLIQRWVRQAKDPDQTYIRIINGSTIDNKSNLSRTFIDTTVATYKGTRLERVELHGELILEAEGAMWNNDLIETHKISPDQVPELSEISIGVDPALTARVGNSKQRTSDSCGIVVSGRGEDGKLYIMEDKTGRMPVDKWVKLVISLYDKYTSVGYKTSVVIESNSGGEDLLSNTFNQHSDGFSNKMSFQYSTDSKMKRAMPYSLKTEKGEIKFVDKPEMQGLWDELCSYEGEGKSPDHMDAFVFSLNGIAPIKKHLTTITEILF